MIEIRVFSYYKKEKEKISEFIKAYSYNCRENADKKFGELLDEQRKFNQQGGEVGRGVMVSIFSGSGCFMIRDKQYKFYCEEEL